MTVLLSSRGGTVRHYTPSGAAGDWARCCELAKLVAGLPAAAGSPKGEISVGPGTLLVDSNSNFNADMNDLIWSFHPNTVLQCTLSGSGGGGVSHAPFYADTTSPLSGASTTALSANASAKSNVLLVTSSAAFTVGDWIAVARSALDRVAIYKVKAKASGQLTLDRPCTYRFLSGDLVFILPLGPVANLKLHFNGALITGTGERALTIVGRGVLVDELRLDTGFTNAGLSFYIGSYDCEIRNLRAVASASIANMIKLESAEACRVVGSTIDCNGYGSLAGINILGGYGNRVSKSRITGAVGDGIKIGATGTGDTAGGARGIKIDSVESIANGDAGIRIGDAAHVYLSNVACNGNTIVGLWADPNMSFATSAGARVTGDGITCNDNVSYGLLCDSAFMSIRGFSTSRADSTAASVCQGFGAAVRSTQAFVAHLILRDVDIRETNFDMTGFVNAGVGALGGDLTIDGGVIEVARTASPVHTTHPDGVYLNAQPAGTRTRIRNIDFAVGSGTPITSVDAVAARFDIESCTTNAGSISVGSTGTARFRGRVSLGTPGGSGKYNRGTVALNGATGVDVDFDDITADDLPKLTKQSDAGTPSGKTPIVTVTAGDKFTVSGVASDTSVFAFEI